MPKKLNIENIDDDDSFAPVSEFIDDIFLIENAKSAKEFHERLAQIIPRVPKFIDKELEYLAKVVAKPWQGKRGPKFKDARLFAIKIQYELKNSSKRRVDAINEIAERYRLNPEAAAKLYDKAIGPRPKKKEK